MKNLLVVMAKEPIPGQVKTRLIPNLTAEEAATLADCFLRDRLTEMDLLSGCDKALAFTPTSARKVFEGYAPDGFALFHQTGRDLGERMGSIIRGGLNDGYGAVAIVGTDSPDLPRSIVSQSFDRLSSDNTDAVIGPASDGGYYLVGMKRHCPELFRDIAWGTEQVLSRTLDIARQLGIRTTLLETWNDIDAIVDLHAFYERNRKTPDEPFRPGRITLHSLRKMKERNRF